MILAIGLRRMELELELELALMELSGELLPMMPISNSIRFSMASSMRILASREKALVIAASSCDGVETFVMPIEEPRLLGLMTRGYEKWAEAMRACMRAGFEKLGFELLSR